jgi:hypothetical protein
MNTRIPARVAAMIAVLLLGLTVGQAAEPGSRSVCIAPLLEVPDGRSAPGLFCESAKLSLKIDAQPAAAWPIKKSVKVDNLDPVTRHRIVVLCAGKRQQSFTFRFSDFKTGQVCLFLNDLYKTAQLWEAKRCPWCKCE